MSAVRSGPVGVGVIGAGKISEQYLANMKTYPDLDVRFVADLVPERARAVADEYAVPGSGGTQQALDRDEGRRHGRWKSGRRHPIRCTSP